MLKTYMGTWELELGLGNLEHLKKWLQEYTSVLKTVAVTTACSKSGLIHSHCAVFMCKAWWIYDWLLTLATSVGFEDLVSFFSYDMYNTSCRELNKLIFLYHRKHTNYKTKSKNSKLNHSKPHYQKIRFSIRITIIQI